MPTRRRNAAILINTLREMPEVRFFPVDTPERRSGWYVTAFSLDIENMNCDIRQFVEAAAAEGAPCWKVFWPQRHTERAFFEKRAFGRSGFPFTSKEYATPSSVDYSQVEVPNSRWHEDHTFTEDDMHQIGGAIVKVIKALSKRKYA
jgi:dTDP-4-amino-4,6-dideoxygalactose transaminase